MSNAYPEREKGWKLLPYVLDCKPRRVGREKCCRHPWNPYLGKANFIMPLELSIKEKVNPKKSFFVFSFL